MDASRAGCGEVGARARVGGSCAALTGVGKRPVIGTGTRAGGTA